jgi:hypothetical protein
MECAPEKIVMVDRDKTTVRAQPFTDPACHIRPRDSHDQSHLRHRHIHSELSRLKVDRSMSLASSHASTDGNCNPGCDSSTICSTASASLGKCDVDRDISASMLPSERYAWPYSGEDIFRAVDLETARGRSCHRMRKSIDLG